MGKLDSGRVKRMKAELGERIRALRGERSQEWLQAVSGVDRKKIGQIENATVDYQINTLLKVIVGLKGDAGDLVLASKDSLVQKVQLILERGTADDIHHVESTVNYVSEKLLPFQMVSDSSK